MTDSIAHQVNREAARRDIPLNAFIDLTWRCNLNCYYCYQKAYPSCDELSLTEWKETMDQLAGAGCFYITFSGGEPLLREDFNAIFTAARDAGCAVSIITNATLLTADHIALLAERGVLDVGVSLLAASARLHDRLCGVSGGFAAANTALRALAAAGVRTIIKHSVSADNFGHYREMQKIADGLGALLECDSIILPDAHGTLSAHALSAGQQRIFLEEMYPSTAASLPDTAEDWNLRCDAGRSICGITPDGRVLPCILVGVPFGALRQQNFAAIWHGPAAREFRAHEAVVDATCRACGMGGSCSRCYGVAWRETGRWHGESPSMCLRAKSQRENDYLYNDPHPVGM
jgi:MoaA/NifB/PqqE/SkfB family radical SAM enzyme